MYSRWSAMQEANLRVVRVRGQVVTRPRCSVAWSLPEGAPLQRQYAGSCYDPTEDGLV